MKATQKRKIEKATTLSSMVHISQKERKSWSKEKQTLMNCNLNSRVLLNIIYIMCSKENNTVFARMIIVAICVTCNNAMVNELPV
jgi:hypothetical protein